MGCLFSKLSLAAAGQGNAAENTRVAETKSSSRSRQNEKRIAESNPNIIPDQPSNNQSTPTQSPITSSDTTTSPVALDGPNNTVHRTDAAAGQTVSGEQPLGTKTENISPPSSVAPDQPRRNASTCIGSSMATSGASAAPAGPASVGGSTILQSQQPSEAQIEKKASALWEEAFKKMREPGDGRPEDETFPNGSLVENIIKELEVRKGQCDNKRWFFIKDGSKVYIVETLLAQLAKYAAIGDIALQNTPDIVALVWAGFRGILQVGTAYYNQMLSVSDSLQYLVKLLCFCDIYEKLYCCNAEFGISKDLNECFVGLYVSILKYLRKASSYLGHSTVGRIAISFSEEMERFLNDIKTNETELNKWVNLAEKEASASNRFDQDKNIKKLRDLLADIQEPIKETLRVMEVIYNHVEKHRRLEILTWLSEVEYESHHLLSQQRRQYGTGSWLLTNKYYVEWIGSEANSILWLRADAGFGKTILASYIVDNFAELSTSDDHVVAYFYCNYKEPARRSTESILRALVKQFAVKAVQENKIPTLLDDIYKNREKNSFSRGHLSSEECTGLIINLSEKYQSTTIIVDALDECDLETRSTLFYALHEIRKKATWVKIVVTSRFEIDINRYFAKDGNYYINAKDNSSDINLYIDAQLKQRCDASNVHREYALLLDGKIEPELKNRIRSTLQSKSHGMFMWVNLQIESLCAAATPGDVEAALDRMPRTLNKTYLQIMERIEAQDPNAYLVAEKILKWLLYAQEACTTASVIQTLEVEAAKQTLNPNGLDWTIPKILGTCKNLVIHDTTLDIFRFAHVTVQEFLLSQEDYQAKSCNTYVAEVCLTTLLYHHAPPENSQLQDLYTYAAEHWAEHVRLSEATSGNVENLSLEFLKPCTPYNEWGNAITQIYDDLEGDDSHIVTPLWVACYYQLHHLAEHLMRVSNQDLNSCNTHGRTPLSWAAEVGHENVVQRLLEKQGVNLSSKDKDGRTPVSWAAGNGDLNVVELLLKAGVNLSSKDKDGRTPVSWAAGNGHENVVKLLLEKAGVDMDSDDNDGRTLLSWAAESGNLNVVELLLKAGVNLSSKDKDGRTPVSWAAGSGHENVVQLLLGKAGVNMDSNDNDGRTPLSWAAESGHLNVVELLLNAGVEVDSKDKDARSPFSWAAGYGHESVVQLLLEKKGVDVNSKDIDARTPLSRAAGNGHEEVVKVLLDNKRVDMNSKDKEARTPLSFAAANDHEEVVQLLLKKEGLELNSKDGRHGQTPLAWAAERGHEKVVQLLLEKEGVDVDSRDNYGRTPLSWAAGYGYENVVQLLLEKKGVDMDSKDEDAWTPLSWAAGKGHENVVQLLLENERVDMDFKDKNARTPLSWAAECGHEKVVQLLLEKARVDVNSKDKDARTPLSFAAQNGHDEVVQLLLEKAGVDMDSKDKDGWTPLSWAAGYGHKNVVQLLLEKEEVDVDSKDKDARTPLSWAAGYHKRNVVQLLLENAGVDVNSKDKDARTPLSWAAANGHDREVQLLLEKEGVDVDSKDKEARTPLSFAAQNGHDEVVQLLLEKAGVDVDSKDKEARTPLSFAAQNGHDEVVQLLLEKAEVDVDSKDKEARTPLSFAAENGHEEVVQLLLEEAGVDVNSKDKHGRTPLSWAAWNRHENVVKRLRAKKGVNFDFTGEDGRIPLCWAAEFGHEDMVQLLLEKEGVGVNWKTSSGRTPLSLAAGNNHEKVVKLLLENERVEVNSKDSLYGESPLCWAAEKGHETVVKLLLGDERVDFNFMDDRGRTPLFWAAANGHEKVVQLLLEKKGLNVNGKDSRHGRTPLFRAAESGHEKVVQLLLEVEAVDVDSRDTKGRTPLDIAREYDEQAVVTLLETRRAELVNVSGPVSSSPVEPLVAT